MRPFVPVRASGVSGPCLLARRSFVGAILLGLLPASLVLEAGPVPAQQPTNIITYLQQRFGLSDRQVRGALGALLVYAHQRLQKSDFDTLAARVPNAERIMQTVKLQGVVNGPMDDVDEYEKTLTNVGIGQPLASQIAPAVLDYLGATGHDVERDILAGILD